MQPLLLRPAEAFTKNLNLLFFLKEKNLESSLKSLALECLVFFIKNKLKLY